MNGRMKVVCCILLIFLSFLMIVHADPPPTPQPPVNPTDESLKSINNKLDENKGWWEKVSSGISEITDKMKEFFDGGLSGLLERTVGTMLESAFTSMSGLIAKWVFLTPRLINYQWIFNLWWICYILSVIAIAIGTGITILKTFGGRVSHSELLKALLIAFLGCTFSLFASDKIIDFANLCTNTIANPVLVEEYKRPENQTVLIVKNLDETKIGFDSFDGVGLCKMAFGGSIGDGEELYKVFLSGGIKSGGGFLIMIWAMILMGLIGLFGILRYGILGILGAVAPLWFAGCAFTGDTKPAVGWLNLYTRSLLITYILDFAWLASVYVTRSKSSDFAEMGQQIIACILFSVAFVLVIWLWFRWAAKAVVQPMTLAGGKVMEHWGQASESMGNVMDRVGSRFGLEGMSFKGGQMMATGSVMDGIGHELQNGTYDPRNGTIRDRLQEARSSYVKRAFNKQADSDLIADVQYGGANVARNMRELEAVGMSSERLHDILSHSEVSGVIDQNEEGGLLIDEDYTHKAAEVVQKAYEAKHLETQDYNGEAGFTFKGLGEQQIREIRSHLGMNRIPFEDLDNLHVSKEEMERWQKQLGYYEPLDEGDVLEIPYKGRQGYMMMSTDTGKQERLEKLLKSYGIDYEKVNNTIQMPKQDYDDVVSKVDYSKRFLETIETDTSGEFNFSGTEDEMSAVAGVLSRLGVAHETSNSVWIGEQSKEPFMESIVELGEASKERYKQEYVQYKLTHNEDLKYLKEVVREKLPGALIENESHKYLTVDAEKATEVEQLIRELSSKTPYWEDKKGGYYYLEKSIGKIVKHLSPPDDGRCMGKYKM